jgi:hypothetical protein
MGDRLRRPLREQPLVAALLAVVVLAIGEVLAAATATTGRLADPGPPPPVLSTPSPVITPTSGQNNRPPTDMPGARQAAQVFLHSYLPLLYRRGRPSSVRGVDAHVRASLQGAAQQPRARADRRPRVAALAARDEGAGRVLMVATIADRVSRAYRIVFAVTRAPDGAWLVSELANY